MDLKRILLIEEDSKDIELMLAALAEKGLSNQVTVVRDGIEALDYLRRRGAHAGRAAGNPAVVFLDLRLPKMDGLKVLAEIKADKDLRSIPIVAVSSSKEPKDIERCYQLGANAYVVKPIQYQAFVEAVKVLGNFWGLVNEPPPGNAPKSA